MIATIENTTVAFPVTKLFVLAGAATFTVNNAAGEHYTYRVAKVQKEGRGPAWFVSLLTGADESYTYLGMMDAQAGTIRTTAASVYMDKTKPFKVIAWAVKQIWAEKELPAGYGINGQGKCGRCGRALTHPDGIADEGYRLGFGPVCWDKMQEGL